MDNLKLFIIYETTNKINGRKYRGAHYGYVDDGYLGSGIAINNAIDKYGNHNFDRQILFCAFNNESMYWAESILASTEWIVENNAYNLRPGGSGGFHKIVDGIVVNAMQIPEVNKRAMDTRAINWEEKYGGHIMNDPIIKQKSIDNRTKTFMDRYGVTKLSDIPGTRESRSKKMSASKWIHNPTSNKNTRVQSNLVQEYLEQGWTLGRI